MVGVVANWADRERLALDHRQNVVFAHQQQFFVADLERLAGVAGEEHAVADLDLQLAARAVVEQLAVRRR